MITRQRTNVCFRQTPEQQLVSSRRSRTVTEWKKKRQRRKEGAARRRGGEAEAPGGAPLHHHLIMPHLTQHYRCIMGSEGGGRGDAELHEYLIKHETTKRRSSRDEEVINIPSGRHADPARRNSSLSSPLSVRAARSPLVSAHIHQSLWSEEAEKVPENHRRRARPLNTVTL